MEIKQYTKKSVQIEAVQLTNENRLSVMEWLSKYNVQCYVIRSPNRPELYIKTLEGDMQANISDYIIKGVKNEFYPCRKDIFEMTYDSN